MVIDKQAIYYVLERVILTENRVDYNYEKLYYELDNTDYSNKETFEKYIKKYDIINDRKEDFLWMKRILKKQNMIQESDLII